MHSKDVPVHAAPAISCPTRTTTASKKNKSNGKILARQTSKRERERKKKRNTEFDDRHIT